jgi:vitamin B12 transporter
LINSLKFRRACALAMAFSCSFASVKVMAQPAEVVVTGSREPLSASRLAADVVVIGADTIRASTADSLADLLRREAGVQMSRNGGPGQSTGLLIRGASSGQTVVLVDGVRIGSATLGSAALEALSLSQIERIEVLRGPGSSLYGADAVGGVVQVFTRAGSVRGAPQGQAALAVGGYGSSQASAGVQGATTVWDYAASAATERSSGVSALRAGDQFGNYNPDRDGFRLDSAQAQLGLRPTAGQRVALSLVQTRLNSQYDASEFLAPSFSKNNQPDFRTRLATDVAALDWRGELAGGFIASARGSRSVDDSRSGGTNTSRFRTTRQLLGAQLAWRDGPLGQWVAALERNEDRASSTSFRGDVQRSNTALVLEFTGQSGPWAWQADARRDDPSDIEAVTTGRVGGAYTLAPGLKLRALAGSTFRAPSFNDLYFPNYGVATLKPERGRSAELGLNWQVGSSRASATLFRNRVADLIGYQSDRRFCPPGAGFNFGCAGNTSRARLQGATLAGAHTLGAWTWTAQFDALSARDQDSGAALPRRADRQGSLGVDWTAGAWSAGASLLHVGSRPDGGKVLAAETTLDLQARWRLTPEMSLQAKLLNASNERIEPARDYQGLGRQAWLVWRYEPRL